MERLGGVCSRAADEVLISGVEKNTSPCSRTKASATAAAELDDLTESIFGGGGGARRKTSRHRHPNNQFLSPS